EKLIVDQAYRLALGQSAKSFVETHWNSQKVAQSYLNLINGKMDAAHLTDPHAIRYLHGFGLAEDKLANIINQIVITAGTDALQLTDKPMLEQQILRFAQPTPTA
ncbi:MAG: hypothetical protein M3Q45_06760, partial [Chloroflexota bacterium]|nr:hypothetical protein [Chloroflexota bacterium]